MGINVKVQKATKLKDIVVEEAKLEKDLKSCMRCKYFHGNNRQCILKKCIKEDDIQKITEEDRENKCFGCPYPHMEGYCFPCMRDILGLLKKKPIVDEQEEKKDG